MKWPGLTLTVVLSVGLATTVSQTRKTAESHGTGERKSEGRNCLAVCGERKLNEEEEKENKVKEAVLQDEPATNNATVVIKNSSRSKK